MVARGFFPVDIHDPEGSKGYQAGGSTWIKPKGPYDIPIRCLIPSDVGRPITQQSRRSRGAGGRLVRPRRVRGGCR